MKLFGRINSITVDYKTGNPAITIALPDKSMLGDELDELIAKEKLSIEIKPFRAKRSLDANAYFWLMLGKLSAVLGVPPTDLYRESIKNVGDNYEVVCVKNSAVDKLRDGWEHNGMGWVTDTIPSKIDGCTNVLLYYGSSTYDTAQMSRLIDNLIQDCKAQGIQTETPNQIAEMLSLWEGK